MQALFGLGEHPNGEEIIAAYLKEHVRAGMTEQQLERGAATRRSPPPGWGAASPPMRRWIAFDSRVRARLAVIREETGREPTAAEEKKVKAEEARRQRAAVAGFDLVFSPVKSAALLWAVDERPLGAGGDPGRARGRDAARHWTWSKSTPRSPGPAPAGSPRSRRTG